MTDRRDIPSIPDAVDPDLRRPLVRMREELQRLIGSRGSDPALRNSAGGRGGSTIIIGGGGTQAPGTPPTIDLTPPPTPSSFAAQAGINVILLSWAGIGYTQGNGHRQANIYGVQRLLSDTSPLPTFGDAQRIATAANALTLYSLPSDASRRWHLWLKFETNDGVESVDPAGGVNGVVAQTADDPAFSLALLEGQITRSMLFTSLGATVDLIEAASSVPGSVNFRIAATAADLTSAFTAADGTTLASAQTYVQSYTFSQSEITGALVSQFNAITANYQAADVAVGAAAQVSAEAFVATYTYAQATIDGALSSLNTSIRADFATADGATLISAQNYTQGYAYALADGNTLAGNVSTIGARVARVKNYRVIADGLNAPVDGAGFYGEDGSVVFGRGRSYNLVVLDGATGNFVSGQFYDVFGNGEVADGRNATTLANDLNALGDNRVVVIYTYDEPRANRLTGGLPAALYRCGASRAVFASENLRIRGAYILVGVPGIGEGQGVEKYAGSTDFATDAFVDYQLQLVNGRPVALGGNPLAVAVQQETIARINADNSLYAQWTVKIDVNGYVSGFGLASTAGNAGPTSSFIVRADSFAVASPTGPGITPLVPFIVRTTPFTEGGVTLQPGVYISSANIVDLAVLYARIGSLVANSIATASLSAAQLTVGDGTVGGNLKSANYSAGTAGWLLQPDGYFEASNAVIRGAVYAGGVFTSTLTINGQFVMGTGDLVSANYVAGVSGYRLGPTSAQLPATSLVGPLSLANAAPGTVNSELLPVIAAALDGKLNRAAADTLNAPITLSTGGAIRAGDTTNGVVMAPTGLAGYKNEQVTFSINTTGDVLVRGTVAVGTAANSGTTMTGSGAVLNASGAFALGIASKNIAFNGTDDPRLNGPWVTDGNLNLTPFSVSIFPSSANYSQLWTDPPPVNLNFNTGTVTATASGGTPPYTYQWTLVVFSASGGTLRMDGPGTASTVSFGATITAFAGSVEGQAVCRVTDANGRTTQGVFAIEAREAS